MRKLLSVLLVVSILSSFGMLAFADSGNTKLSSKDHMIVIKASLSKGQILTSSNLKSLTHTFRTNNLNDNDGELSLTLNPKDNVDVGNINEYTAIGDIKLDKKIYTIKASGAIDVNQIDNERLFYAGNLSGEIYNNDEVVNEITLSIQYSPQTKKAHVNVVIGVDSEENPIKPLILTFGEMSEENNIYYGRKLKSNDQDENSVMNMDNFTTDNTISTLSEEGLSVKATGSYSSSYGNLLYVAGYHHNSVPNRANQNFAIRTWGNTINAEAYIKNVLGKSVLSSSAHAHQANLGIYQSVNWAYIAPAIPDSEIEDINVPIPVNFGGTIGFQMINLNFITESTIFTPKRLNGSATYNAGEWAFSKNLTNFGSDIINSVSYSTTPWSNPNDEKGFGASAIFTYSNPVSSNTSKSVSFVGRINYEVTVSDISGYSEFTYPISKTVNSTIIVTP